MVAAHSDMRNFVTLGRHRDRKIHASHPDLATGPAGWIPVWLSAWSIVRTPEVWAVVELLADDLKASPRALTGQEIEGIVARASGGRL